MKHLTMIIAALLFALFATAQELPMRPQGVEHVTGLILRQTQGLQTGDWVFTYYEQGKTKYMTGKQEVSEIHKDNGMMISALNSNQPEHPNGNPPGVTVKAGLWRNGDMFELNPQAIYQYSGKANMIDERQVKNATAGPLTIFYFYRSEIGKSITDLKEVPYFTWFYSQCPQIKIKTIDAGEVNINDQIYIYPFNPSFCKSFTREIIKGTGKIIMVNSYTPYYVVGKGDKDEVIIRIKTIPFPNCNEDNVIFNCKIKLKTPDVEVPNLPQNTFNTLIKYCFEVTKKDGTINACWTDKRWTKDLPDLKMELFVKRPGFWKTEIAETRITTDPHPCEHFVIPDHFLYFKVTAVHYGYIQTFHSANIKEATITPDPVVVPEILPRNSEVTFDHIAASGKWFVAGFIDGDLVIENLAPFQNSKVYYFNLGFQIKTSKGGNVIGSDVISGQSRNFGVRDFGRYARQGCTFTIHWSMRGTDIQGTVPFTLPPTE